MKSLVATIAIFISISSSHAGGIDELVAGGAEIEKLADGFGFTEGPAWHAPCRM